MPFRYNYAGVLSRDVIRSLEETLSSFYTRVIEIREFPDYDAFSEVFADRTYDVTGEGCMGETTHDTRQGVRYCWIVKDFVGDGRDGFICLPDDDAHARFLAAFPELVVNEDPFTTSFGS